MKSGLDCVGLSYSAKPAGLCRSSILRSDDRTHACSIHPWMPPCNPWVFRLTQEVLRALRARGISIRVATKYLAAEEAPESYKDVDEVVQTCHAAGISRKVREAGTLCSTGICTIQSSVATVIDTCGPLAPSPSFWVGSILWNNPIAQAEGAG